MSGLEKGHIADMFHAGTRRYYRVEVIEETYTYEQEGPFYENRPITIFGGIAGGGGAPGEPRQLRVSPEPNWRDKCISLLRLQRGAALNAIVEEGFDGDGVDYEGLYKLWSRKPESAKSSHDHDPGDCHE